jgi:transcriptional regulator GlxA family with amidase domain
MTALVMVGSITLGCRRFLTFVFFSLLFETTMSRSGEGPDRYHDIVRKLDKLIEKRAPSQPLYSKELAELIGVSARTLQNATHRCRGMSLHSYVRWTRLTAARQKLRRGATSVKNAALESGFWHFGDFARQYRKLFGELPSSTLQSARSRLEDHPRVACDGDSIA